MDRCWVGVAAWIAIGAVRRAGRVRAAAAPRPGRRCRTCQVPSLTSADENAGSHQPASLLRMGCCCCCRRSCMRPIKAHARDCVGARGHRCIACDGLGGLATDLDRTGTRAQGRADLVRTGTRGFSAHRIARSSAVLPLWSWMVASAPMRSNASTSSACASQGCGSGANTHTRRRTCLYIRTRSCMIRTHAQAYTHAHTHTRTHTHAHTNTHTNTHTHTHTHTHKHTQTHKRSHH